MGALHPAHVLVGHEAVRRLWRPLLVNGGRHTSDLALDPVSGSLEREVGTDKLEAGSRVISADVVVEERLSDGLLGIEQRTSWLVRIEAMLGKALSEFLFLQLLHLGLGGAAGGSDACQVTSDYERVLMC